MRRGSRVTQPQDLAYRYSKVTSRADFTRISLPDPMAHTTHFQSLLAGHAKCCKTTTTRNNHLLPPAAFLASPQRRRRKGREDCPKQGEHTLRRGLAIIWTAHPCNSTSICLPSTAIMGCPRMGWREGDCSNRRKMKRRWRTTVRTTLRLNF